jgi:hypothetical protein
MTGRIATATAGFLACGINSFGSVRLSLFIIKIINSNISAMWQVFVASFSAGYAIPDRGIPAKFNSGEAKPGLAGRSDRGAV